jgi:hypothetical protein
MAGCKKDNPVDTKNEIDTISGTYYGMEYRSGTGLSGIDSSAMNVSVNKIDATSFEIIYQARDPYPKKFMYSGFQYNFIQGGSFPTYHTIVFAPDEKKLTLNISYDDGQGHSGTVLFVGKK